MGDLSLHVLTELVSDAVRHLDSSLPPFKQFAPGIGPYGEPQLCRALVDWLNAEPKAPFTNARTKRQPDILIPDLWAIEVKLARPFGDNAREAEHWSQNLLHPYPGNVSSLGDAVKLRAWTGPERRAILVLGFEHEDAHIDLENLFRGFEVLATQVMGIVLSTRAEQRVSGLRHHVHRVCRVSAWEVMSATALPHP